MQSIPAPDAQRPRVLFVTEPYPCRSGGFDFEQPFLLFWRLAFCLTKARLAYCSIVASTDLLDKYTPDIDSFSPARSGIPSEQPPGWQAEWLDMLNGQLLEPWQRFYDDVLDRAQPDVIYIWNVNEYLRRKADERGIATVYMEQGLVRTVSGYRYTIDPRNYGPRSHFRQLLDGPVLETQPAMMARQWIADHVLADVFQAAGGITPRRTSGKSKICVLGQKDDDVNNLLFSPFSSQRRYFEQVLDRLNKQQNVDITVRLHPLSSDRDQVSELLQAFNVRVDDSGGDIRKAITESDAFITVNSTAGFEAMLCGKPTMVLGKAGYCAPREDLRGLKGIDAFVSAVQEGAYWTEAALDRVAGTLALYIRHFSLAQHVAGSAAIHAELIHLARAGGRDWSLRFTGEDRNLADLALGHLGSQVEHEAGFARYINHVHSVHGSQLSTRVAELQTENAIRIDQIAAVEARLGHDGGHGD